MSEEKRYEYRVMYRFYRDADDWQVKRGYFEVGYTPWMEFKSQTARQNKPNTYGTLGVARNLASRLRNMRWQDTEVRVERREIRPQDWEVVE